MSVFSPIGPGSARKNNKVCLSSTHNASACELCTMYAESEKEHLLNLYTRPLDSLYDKILD